MTVVIEEQLQAKRHAVADASDEFEVRGLPLLTDELLHFLQGLRESRINASLEHIPEILDRVEIRTPGGPFDERHSFLVQISDCLGGGVEVRVVLLENPRATGGELTERCDKAVAENVAM